MYIHHGKNIFKNTLRSGLLDLNKVSETHNLILNKRKKVEKKTAANNNKQT